MQRRVILNRGHRSGVALLSSPSRSTPLYPISMDMGMGGRESVPEVSDLLTAAQRLSPEQRRELLDRLALETQKPRSRNDRDVVMWSQAIYEAIVEAFGDASGLGGPAAIQRLVAPASNRASVEEFMQATGLAKLNVREQQVAYRLIARLLVDRAREVARHSGLPFSVKLTINCLGELRGIFDRAFPGYLRNGLAALIVRRMVSGEAATTR